MGNSASVTPKGTTLAAPRPDIDVEICPPGTMAAMEALEAKLRLIHDDPRYKAVWQSSQIHIGRYEGPQYEEELDRVTAILTAHCAQLDPGPTIKQSLTVQSTCKPSLQVDYTSETEDLTTWPQTRGPEWRRMGESETLQIGDVFGDDDFFWVGGVAGKSVAKLFATRYLAWTRRPAPEAQP